ncbi:MAG: putative Glycosyl transferase, group 1 [Fibrobacteria bacterium]|jgi:glycosyltransferase involved in cell wall biosynthesis|nr:putative Glycosyl transferase, group 1 [Fibrobacteria bacterium]
MYDVVLTCNYSPWSSYRGGGQKSTHMVATALAALGKRVCVVYSKGPFERVPVPPGLPYDVAWAFFFAARPGISSPLRFLNGIPFYFKARALVRQGGGTALVLHGNGDEASLFGYVRGKRKFVYSHRYPGFESFMFRTQWGTWKTRLGVFFREPRFAAFALALRGADVVTCTSASSAGQLRACFQVPDEKIRVIPNGIDPAFLEAPPPGADARGIVYYGRLTRAKGVDTLLNAYAGLPGATQRLHPLTVIGDGPYAAELRALAARLGVEARWIPWLDSAELARAITEHRLAALPSREESFGNTMLETLATGQALVTARAGSIPEVVGDQAELVPPDDPEALRAAIARALAAPHDPERAAARREYVRARFSWESTARAFLELYGG